MTRADASGRWRRKADAVGARPGAAGRGILEAGTELEVTVRIALAQIITGRDLDRNLDLVREYAARAKAGGADLVVFPEATMRAFGNSLVDIAEPLDGPWASSVRAIAAEQDLVLVAGMFTPGAAKDGSPRVRNTLLVTGPGVSASYDKIHLFDAFGFAESDTVEAGTEPVTFDVGGVTVGLATCYDVRFPDLFTELADRGAVVTLVSASWGGGPGKAEQWTLLTRARAADSTSFVVACGQADPSSAGLEVRGTAPTGVGHSLVASPFGEAIAELGAEPDLLFVDLDSAEVDAARKSLPVLANRHRF